MPRHVVATFNVRNSFGRDGLNAWPFRRGRCLRTIRDLGADVVALQEVRRNQFRYFVNRLGDYHVVGVGRDDGLRRGEHMVLLFRKSRFETPTAVARWFTMTPEIPSRHAESAYNRFALIATVEGVQYIATHLDEKSQRARRESVERIATWCEDTCVVLGDFNCDIDDEILDPLWSRGMRDALDQLPARGPKCTTHHSFTGTLDGNRIDHIIVASNLRVASSRIVHQPASRLHASDHWPVVAELEF